MVAAASAPGIAGEDGAAARFFLLVPLPPDRLTASAWPLVSASDAAAPPASPGLIAAAARFLPVERRRCAPLGPLGLREVPLALGETTPPPLAPCAWGAAL